jgi:hypothetical protein
VEDELATWCSVADIGKFDSVWAGRDQPLSQIIGGKDQPLHGRGVAWQSRHSHDCTVASPGDRQLVLIGLRCCKERLRAAENARKKGIRRD